MQSNPSNPTTHRITTFIAAALIFGVLCLSGCGTLKEGADPVVVRAEQATVAALETFDAFLLIEHQNRAVLHALDPGIHLFADRLRANAPRWLASARAMTKAYKANRTPDSRASLQTALAVLAAGLAETQSYLVKTKTATP